MAGKPWSDPTHPAHGQSSGPSRGYSWPPAQVGNTLAVKHGARSRSNRLVEPAAVALAEEITEVAPHLADPSYAPAVMRWAIAEAWCDRLGAWLAENGWHDADGKPRPVLDALRLWQRRASDEADRLGLTPLARAKLGRDASATELNLASLWAEMARREQERTGAE